MPLEAHHGAALRSPEPSVRQVNCLVGDACLYAPLTVRINARSHMIASTIITAKRSKMTLFESNVRGPYCKNGMQDYSFELELK